MNSTLKYYNQNANQFVQGTFAVDFKQTQDRFLINLPAGAYILDVVPDVIQSISLRRAFRWML